MNSKGLKIFLITIILIMCFVNVNLAQDIIKLRWAADGSNDFLIAPDTAIIMNLGKTYLEGKGNWEVQLFPDMQLGDKRAVYEQVKEGLVHIYSSAEPTTIGSIEYPPLTIFGMPWLYPDEYAANAVTGTIHTSEFIRKMSDDMAEKTGVRLLAVHPTGFRNLTTAKKAVQTVADLKGLKIRTMPAPIHIKLWTNMGADPVPISWSETYTSLQTGVADGQENPYKNIKNIHLDEVQDYCTTTGHVMSHESFITNEEWFQSLSDIDRQNLLEMMDIVDIARRGASEWANYNYRGSMDLQYIDLTPEEKAAFKEASNPDDLIEVFRKEELGEEYEHWLDEILKLIEQSKNEISGFAQEFGD